MKTTFETNQRADIAIKNAKELLINPDYKSYNCITAWFDLLGFNHHINKEYFEIEPKSTIGFERIATFHETSLLTSNPNHQIVQLNDSTIISIDIPNESQDQNIKTLSNFFAILDHFWEVSNIADKKIGGPGIRGVVSLGKRYNLRGNYAFLPSKNNEPIPVFVSPTPIMMNMPFAKSYITESSGQLLKEPSLYIEKRIFEELSFQHMETWEEHDSITNPITGEYILVRRENE